MNRIFKSTLLPLLLLALSACGGGSTGFTPGYTIGGNISGLITGRTLVLQNNGGNGLTRTASGAFTFATRLQPNTTYIVTILTQPAGENCVVTSGGSGTATANVTNIVVTCTPLSYTVGVTVTGLTAGSVTLLDNNDATDPITQSANSTYTFVKPVVSGNAYSVTVSAQPSPLICTVTNGSGTMVVGPVTATVTCNPPIPPCDNVTIFCYVGGTLTGLQAGQSITFGNGLDSFTKTGVAGNGTFTFPTGLVSGAGYNVSITASPTNQPCSVTYGAGTVTNTSISNVNVFCGYPLRGDFSSATSMAKGRHQHTATRITAGTKLDSVLIVGGKDSTGAATGSVEMYNSSGSSPVGMLALPTPRYLHTATALPDGKVLVVGGRDGTGAALGSAYRYDPATDTWTAAGSLTTARYSHTATLLTTGTNAGKVLVVGGTDGTTGLATAQMYNPGANSWSTATASPAHYQHTATLLSDGRVLVVGGKDAAGVITNNVEYYDPAADSWTTDTAMTGPRTLHTATLLASGKVLVTGGDNGSTIIDTAEVYTPGVTTGTWANTAGKLAGARYSHTATLLNDGTNRVLVTGGCNVTTTCAPAAVLATAEFYDPVADAWSTAGNLAGARYEHAAVLLVGGKVLVTGGNSGSAILATAELYDPAAISWTATGTLTARSNHSATRPANGRVLVAGGYSGSAAMNSSELYDPAAGTWASTKNSFLVTTTLAVARYDHTATLLNDGTGRVLVVGGHDGSVVLKSAEIYDPTNGNWTTVTVPDLAVARSQHTATLLFDGRVLVTGGWDGGVNALTDAEIYDPATNTWASVGTLAAGRYQHTATLLHGGKVLVTGGTADGSAGLSSAEVFDPYTLVSGVYSWSDASGGVTPGARRQHSATLLPDGTVLVAGGMNGATKLNTTALYTAPNTWAAKATLTGARTLHTATLIPSDNTLRGKVLVVGGRTTPALATVELYDPNANTWTLMSGNLVAARYQHAATLLENGKLLVTGGYNGTATLSSAELGW